MMNKRMKLIPYEINENLRGAKNKFPYGIKQMNARRMWDEGYTGKNIVVGIIDTGCDISHPLLKGKIIGGANFSDDSNGNKNIYEDFNGHGTHVAGIIAASNYNNEVMGVAPDCKLLIAKALNKDGTGTYQSIINAINFAVNNKVDIISMSLGGNKDDKNLKNAVMQAVKNNISVVCAAGNNGDGDSSTSEYSYPASYAEVIEVGAINENYLVEKFSNSNTTIDLVAPGRNIISTYMDNKLAIMSGTSMSAPYVSGSLALIKEWAREEFERDLDEAELYAQLIKCTRALGIPRTEQGNGYLYLNLYKYKNNSKR
ncbi:serine protease [Clostridioides difficile]